MNIQKLASIPLDEALDELEIEVRKLSRGQFAAFFATSAEALLSLYDMFVADSKWGDPEVLREAIRLVWAFVFSGHHPQSGLDLLDSVQKATPDGEEFEAPESTFAQDVAICVDAAVRAATPGMEISPRWVQYAVEAATITACMEDTGFTDLGSSDESDIWRKGALRNSGLRRAVEACFLMLEFLRSKPEVSAADIPDLKLLSRGLLVKTERRGDGKESA